MWDMAGHWLGDGSGLVGSGYWEKSSSVAGDSKDLSPWIVRRTKT